MKGKKSRKWRKGKPQARAHGVRADEAYEYGPLTIARFGRTIQFTNNSSPEDHAEFLKRAREAHKQIIQELEKSVPELQELVMKYDPIEIMHRAAYVLLPLFMKHRLESEYSKDEVYSLPIAEYLQYLIARSPVKGSAVAPNEKSWEELWSSAVAVIQQMEAYLMTRPTSQPPTQVDTLRFELDQMNLLMRVKRYPVFLPNYLTDALKPFEAEIADIFGISVDEVVQGLSVIDEYQKVGVAKRHIDMNATTLKLYTELSLAGYNISPDATTDEQAAIQAALVSEQFKTLHQEAGESAKRALTTDLFDITDLTPLPKQLLDLLSVSPGESVLTTLTGPNKEDLSPISTSILHYKPFLKIDGRYYTFFHSGFEDHMSDIIERELWAKYPNRRSTLEKRRSDHLELRAKELLTSVLKADFALLNLHYPDPDHPGSMAELDILIGTDDVLLIVEVKSGAISEDAKRGAPLGLADSLTDLIFEGQRQSERAERYLKSAESVNFYDQTEKKVVKTIHSSKYRKVFRVVVTKEQLGWVGAQLAQVSMLDPSLSVNMPWHISIDDLRVVSELFANDQLGFAHYLEQRLTAGAVPELAQNDEIDHVGLYYKINHYHDLPAKGGDIFKFDASYMKNIDIYFSNRNAGIEAEKPKQNMPPKMRALMSALENSRLPRRFALASDVLDLDATGREQIEQVISLLQQKQSEGRRLSTIRLPLSKHGYGLSFTLADGDYWDKELRRSAVQMGRSNCGRWMIARINASSNPEVIEIAGVHPDDYSQDILDETSLEMDATHSQKEFRAGKIGRNQPCYCGSEKKYKRCHGAL